MPLILHRPRAPLDAFVDFLWLSVDEQVDRREAIVPSGTVEIVVSLCDDDIRIYDPARLDHCTRLSGAGVSGTYDRPFVVDARQHAGMMGVHFKPGGAFPFLGVDLGALGGSHVDLHDLWGPRADELRGRLRESPRGRFALLEDALMDRWVTRRALHPAVLHALHVLQQRAAGPLAQLAADAGLSQRRFIELFTRQVGLPPKVFLRILRFQKAKQRLLRAPRMAAAELALECGYCDQSHMINEFRALAQVTPMELTRRGKGVALKDDHLVLAPR